MAGMKAPPDLPSHVVVLGLMGAGKTTVGREIAARLRRPLRDSDADVEASTEATVRELRERIGVKAMHGLEARQLLDSLVDGTPNVIAAAASVIDDDVCRAALRAPGVASIWLRADPAFLAARFASSAHRPAYGPAPADFLADEAARRDALYLSVDPIVVDVEGRTPQEIADVALRAMGGR